MAAIVLGALVVFALGAVCGWNALKGQLTKQGYRLRWQRDEKVGDEERAEGASDV